ncbi:hypothetical protein [Mycobacteroides abscessus]|uniref:hypothetical protein n=1 Tax=Mycobacteroides abscessus TaxID=36809 RepID=UPI0009295ED3|nr:hypothetical protein [Mycobacteroides abscessus]SIE16481.1 Uncharacterised protein [Mycobacteroides abscessus subsp. abscessus]
MIWAPLPGGGYENGYRYRDTLRPLATPELNESYTEALALIEELAQNPAAQLGDWKDRGPALSVYAQWAVYALRDRGVLTGEEAVNHFKHLAALQQKNGLYQGFPGIHYGKSIGWLAPKWWETGTHKRHQAELRKKNPAHYTKELFEYWGSQQDWRWIGASARRAIEFSGPPVASNPDVNAP